MKKLQLFAIYALATPIIALGAGAVLAEQESTGQDATQSTLGSQSATNPQRAGTPETTRRGANDKSQMTYMDVAPVNGMLWSDIMGAEATTSDDVKAGLINDLIIDENGRVVAFVVGLDGFFGMGEKDFAIDWDDVTGSGSEADLKLRLDVSEEQLRAGPRLEIRN